MKSEDCIRFLQWALPRLGMRWPGFRKVRGQVCKRVGRRLGELGLSDVRGYQRYLEAHPEEWRVLDRFCAITISRFYRDRGLWRAMQEEVLPVIARAAAAGGVKDVRGWVAGCASGEEAYTLKILWDACVQPDDPGIVLRLLATDLDENCLRRAREGLYAGSSLKDLPAPFLEDAFTPSDGKYRIRDTCRANLTFRREDIRAQLPPGPFDLILCRNLVFTYFDLPSQRKLLAAIVDRLAPGGALVIGMHESLPSPVAVLSAWLPAVGIYRKATAKS